ncbi:glutamate--tRNA ligase [Clostridiaceae bacterium M8S5]|nr:glutamate--tRNA ligase [Clostridiaceae bacterium M8S5]
MSDVRVRFAPSPTGYVHIGSLRTALYDYVFAKQKGGKYILRIEDTDRTRYVDDAIENLVNALLWAGIEHDEGVFLEDGKIVEKGEYGPYIQSERLDIYQEYIKILLDKGLAYYCFCSKERLDEIREKQRAEGIMKGYDGHCRELSKDEIKARLKKGESYTIRLKMPSDKEITFDDLVRGKITINSNEVDDQVLIKSDGFPTYHFAVVVDDYLMKITHVIRGEEWITSTPKHVYMFEAFGWEAPKYVHLPTVLNSEKKKLSKRHGDVSVSDFKDKGYLPEALVNYLALVGWSPESNKEFFTMDELIEEFSFDRVSKTGGVFDRDKLKWVNANYIRNTDVERITELALPHLIEAGFIKKEEVSEKYDWIVALVASIKDRLSYVGEIGEKVKFLFDNEIKPENDETLEMLRGEQVPALLDAMIEEVESVDEIDADFAKGMMKSIGKKTKIKGKQLFMPARAALSGQLHGPDFDKIIFVLGKQNILERIKYVKDNYL